MLLESSCLASHGSSWIATAEQKAAQARYERLQQMQIDKKCPTTPVVSQEQNQGDENTVRTVELIKQNPENLLWLLSLKLRQLAI